MQQKHLLPGHNMPAAQDHAVSAIKVLSVYPGLGDDYARTRELCSSVMGFFFNWAHSVMIWEIVMNVK